MMPCSALSFWAVMATTIVVTASFGTVSHADTTAVVVVVAPNDVGPTFDGIGGASGGGGGTRLLIDYPRPQRDDILDMLFKPFHGAALQHLKVEIGCDGDTTQGSEQTHARSKTDVDFDRGYEVWFMEEAVKRQPGIQLSGWVNSMYKRVALSPPARVFSRITLPEALPVACVRSQHDLLEARGGY